MSFMIFPVTQLFKKIGYYFILPIKILKKLILPVKDQDLDNDLACKRIFRRNKLDIILDNHYSPEEGRDLLNIFLKVKNSFSINNNNIIISRNSSLNGYLTTIINHLNLKPIALCKDFNLFLLKLSKVSTIYLLDPSFSLFLFRDIPYLTKLRMNCQDELIIAIKIYIPGKKIVSLGNFKRKNYVKTFYVEKDELYYTDHYIRWFLHNIGFFEVLGPFTTTYPREHCIRSRLIAENGHYAITSDKKINPTFKGISIYRASTKTFFNYLEKLSNEN